MPPRARQDRPAPPTPEEVAGVRRFNRFYTARLRLLDRSHLQRPFLLGEVRVLYELAHRDAPTAAELAETLRLDRGQLSRLLGALGRRGLVQAKPDPKDQRRRSLALTPAGRRAFARLNTLANEQVGELLAPLPPAARESVVAAMATVQRSLETPAAAVAREVRLRDPLPGDLGWVVERHGALYASEYSWDSSFERLVAGILAEFHGAEAGARERGWIATLDGRRAGCIFLMKKSAKVAKLRLLLVEPWARGAGIGARLARACIDEARSLDYRRMTLWTNSNLDAARHIYIREGFTLIDESPHRSFGHDLVGQTWERDL